MAETKRSRNPGMWIALGAGIGAALGVAIGKIAIGVAVGVAVGLAMSVVFSGGGGSKPSQDDSGPGGD